ncbi:MAG: UDP-N-acetylmuramate dehydrogenase [Chloroflexi bacterium]|jgi:UDP-N-acetylmuramate dehydrogenase|nr:UDP-N-acetylmuramate dehydrogenase [Chloroflexota bacterium]MBT3669661.1 UDP-N-acetylmuramate dehydrogenase [Chloroflexota bacterium]MBT4305088.1 UDP-N-acetylmuramate dehydrogenase [Chloroflexota bacterium]MBT4533391.1 UDP-N-acetylmuramate dehydrogenase [Chloroflexota bacterium]MBT4684200.1 UDP-N-acetylmuramate dehydrogenase [Chloroflexota bacterium]
MNNLISDLQKEKLINTFGEYLIENAPLAKFSSARLGGYADFMLTAHSAFYLEKMVTFLWEEEIPFHILGGGSNILISDAGVRQLVILNKAKKLAFNEDDQELPTVWAESGTNFGSLARQAAQKGFSGLEWAAGIPGTLGGAIFGNAGAHGKDMSNNLKLAEVLQLEEGRKLWSVNQMGFTYRNSTLKTESGKYIVLSATLNLEPGKPEEIQEKMEEYLQFRRRTQPPGASMGSMFKNPAGDHAGRLIEVAGLKGSRIGDAQISELHANFFINHGEAKAQDVYQLIQLAQEKVKDQFDVLLELEIQLFGDWK